MPFILKPGSRQTGTPSPTPGDFLNTLLIVKDKVNGTLLTEHTKLADLSNVLSDVEDQIRDAVELTVKNLKTEYEKRRRRTVAGIKRLQDSLKSLSKSESKCKASEKYCKNADAKKAKRRIKDATKTLQEFTSSDIDFLISTFVADQITLLCQHLMQLPPKLSSGESKEECYEIPRPEKSDSSSEGSSRVNTPTNHIYAEINVLPSRNSTYLTPRRSTCTFPSECNDSTETCDKGSPVPRLNSVVLFSSDSEDDYGFGDSKKKRTKRPKSAGSGNRKSRSNKKSCKPKSRSPDYEILYKPTSNELFRRSGSAVLSPSRSRQANHVRSLSPFDNDDYEKPINRETESLGAPIKEYIKRMSPSCEIDKDARDTESDKTDKETVSTVKNENTSMHCFVTNKSKEEALSQSSRATHSKRFLPATPKYRTDEIKKEVTSSNVQTRYVKPKSQQGTDETDGILLEDTTDSVNFSMTANSTVELLNAAQNLLKNSQFAERFEDEGYEFEGEMNLEKQASHEVETKQAPLENDYIDVEEIKFRESVRSARREIIDKLKNKYVHTAALDRNDKGSDCKSSMSNANTDDQDFIPFEVLKDSKYKDIHKNDSRNTFTSYGKPDSPIGGANKSHSKALLTENGNEKKSHNSHSKFKGQHTGVYKSKLIYTYETGNKSKRSNHDHTLSGAQTSLVTSAIKMFEKASINDEHTYSRVRKQKPVVKYELNSRYRSASEPRTAVSSLKEHYRGYMPSYAQPNKALQPRIGIQSQWSNGCENGDSDHSESSNLSRSCTENDLLNLVRNESSSSIRKHWSKRRASSIPPRISDVSKVIEPAYEYWCSFSIPERTSRCFISAIVVLEDRSIVLLDELHSYLHLFDKAFKHKDQYRLLDIPRGCIKVNSDTVAVAFPYKKCICTYCIKIGAILSGTETSVPCREWIVDIAFSKRFLYVLCKAGDVHMLTENGAENKLISVGMSGMLFIPPNERRIFILGEGRVSKFDMDGTFVSSKADIDAHSMIFLENKIYVADRQRHKLVPLYDSPEGQNLIDVKIEYPTAVGSSVKGDIVLVSQFEESMDFPSTTTIHVLRLKRK